MNEALIAVLSAAGGFLAKSIWESYLARKREHETEVWRIRVAELEKRLSQFLWPIYLRLQRDNVVWRRILDREHKDDADRSKLAYQIESDVLLPNHTEILTIIERNMHLAGRDQELEKELLAYVRHVDVYRALRKAGITNKDPIAFEEPWPKGLFFAIESRLETCQREYDRVLKDRAII